MKIKPHKGDKWTREEMILVLNLYFKIPFMKFRSTNPSVIELANKMGRTNNSIAIRLTNFASCDPNLIKKGIKGMDAHRKMCQPYWDEFASNRQELVYESEKILAEYEDTNIEEKFKNVISTIPIGLKGTDRIVEIKKRVNQHFFRNMVLTNYQGRCALTGIDIPELLVASHIIPWASNEHERLNPSNGICLSALYDKAFDRGLISFSNDGTILFSEKINKNIDKEYYNRYFEILKDKKLNTPSRYAIDPTFLEWHRDTIFEK